MTSFKLRFGKRTEMYHVIHIMIVVIQLTSAPIIFSVIIILKNVLKECEADKTNVTKVFLRLDQNKPEIKIKMLKLIRKIITVLN